MPPFGKRSRLPSDVNHATLPGTLYENGIEIRNKNLADHFAGFFDNKIQQILSETSIDHGNFNGYRKLHCDSVFFMDKNLVRECMESLVTKN